MRAACDLLESAGILNDAKPTKSRLQGRRRRPDSTNASTQLFSMRKMNAFRQSIGHLSLIHLPVLLELHYEVIPHVESLSADFRSSTSSDAMRRYTLTSDRLPLFWHTWRVSFRQNLARRGRRFAVKRKRFSVEQIVGILKQAEVGVPVVELCRQAGITEQTFYRC